MMNNRIFINLEMVGETAFVLAAALWITKGPWVPYVACIGAIMAVVGRFCTKQQTDGNTTLRRLFHLRKVAIVFMLLSAGFMFVDQTKYLTFGEYVFNSSWLVFFVMFAVIEVYTSIRLLYITREK